MRWFLLLVVLFFHTAALSQGTLKIFVAIDDGRNDMDIIDLNTAALDNYGVSVDSTNINFYTTTMSTQVVRLTREQLFGPEEEEEFDLETPVASIDIILEEEPIIRYTNQELREVSEAPQSSYQKTTLSQNRAPTKNTSKKSRSTRKLKKSKRFKKYKGKCPKF